NELFDGFGLQKPLPKQQKESTVPALAKVPQSQQPVVQIPQTLNLDVAQKLEFIPDNSQLNDQNLTLLNNLAIVLKEYPNLSVEIQGNLPAISKINSQDVDSKRVVNTRSYLISKGIRSNQILVRSTGKPKEKETEKGELKLVINGNSDTFIAMAGRLKNGGLSSPLLETLQASLPPEVLNQVPANTVPETVASVPNLATPIKADQSLNFSLNADINPNNQKALDEIALTLQKEPNKTVELQGYLKGGNNTNPDLEMERVIAVRTYLLDKGVKEDQVIIRELVGDTVASNNQQNKVDLLFGNNGTDNNTAQSKPVAPVALNPTENNPKPVAPVALNPT
ncbi:MAG TPA: OmpA family protein, partial [Allocoleopsis sp.]